MIRLVRRAEEWSGVPLRWMLRRIFCSVCVAVLVGMAVAVTVVIAEYHSDVPRVVNGERAWRP